MSTAMISPSTSATTARGPDNVIPHLFTRDSMIAAFVMTGQRRHRQQCQSGDNGENRFNQHLYFQVPFST
jgi:hypothetical protein